MKKFIALFAICAMVTSLLATEMPATETNWVNGGFTLPIVYTGTLKAAGWEDEGLCYNWEKEKNSLPLFLGFCQPCLNCVPCDIDMQHKDPAVQNNPVPPGDDAIIGGAGIVDPTEAYFNRARLYIVTNVDKKNKTAVIQVVDLIDAYSATVKPYTRFQFYNTVDSKGKVTLSSHKGKIAAFYSFPIFDRKKAGSAYFLNQYTATSTGTGADDGIGMAALIGDKDSKNWFKFGTDKYKIVTIKKLAGDMMLAQDSFTDTPCRRGDQYTYNSTLPIDNPEFDGEGAWWNTASVSLRRNNSVTKKMIAAVIAEAGSANCIPCNRPGDAYNCREYLDSGMIDLMIEKKYKKYEITYLVDTSLDYIYGDTGAANESFVGSASYLGGLVNIHE